MPADWKLCTFGDLGTQADGGSMSACAAATIIKAEENTGRPHTGNSVFSHSDTSRLQQSPGRREKGAMGNVTSLHRR